MIITTIITMTITKIITMIITHYNYNDITFEWEIIVRDTYFFQHF